MEPSNEGNSPRSSAGSLHVDKKQFHNYKFKIAPPGNDHDVKVNQVNLDDHEGRHSRSKTHGQNVQYENRMGHMPEFETNYDEPKPSSSHGQKSGAQTTR